MAAWLAGLALLPALQAQPACRPCHTAIYDAYLKTGMGRSIAERPLSSSEPFYHRLSNRHYVVEGGVMRRHQIGAAGQRVNEIEKRIDFGIGSGNHAITWVNRTTAGLFLELPLSWYRERNGLAMSPGYDRPDHPDMRREISPACLFCHAAYPAAKASATPRSIDCARCHGPAEQHLASPKRGTILNPARLPANRRLEVCLQCHLETVSQGIADSFRRPKRGVYSFRPGEPLADYKLYFDRADPPEPRFEVNHAGYRLLQSACFNGSKGQMTCTTCHDPHTAKARPACASCHPSEHARETTDCIGCHMPKRKPSDAIHVTVTDHWIQKRPKFTNPEREALEPYRGAVAGFYTAPDPLTLGLANIQEPTPAAIGLYQQHLRRDPNDVPTLAALGNALYRLGRRQEAVLALERALNLDPTHPGALNTLAIAEATAGKYERALDLLERCRATRPDHALTWFNLGATHQALERRNEAIASFREAIRLQPDFAEARARLAALNQ